MTTGTNRPEAGAEPADVARLTSADGTPVIARHLRPPGPPGGACAVAVHGFTGSFDRHPARELAAGLARCLPVVAVDLRGHGRSGGSSTVGEREVLDVAAAVAWAGALGYRRVVLVGWSLGAAVVLRAAVPGGASPGHPELAGVVAMSGPSRWNYRGTAPMRRLHHGIGTAVGRRVLRGAFATRMSSAPWEPWPLPPDACAARLRVPLLVVHGDADRYFPLEHARWLAAAAGPRAQLWVEAGLDHAAVPASADLLRRVGAWAARIAA